MNDLYGNDVTVGDKVLTWVKEGKGTELKEVIVSKVNPNTIEFIYDYVPTVRYYSPSTNVAKRKSNQIILIKEEENGINLETLSNDYLELCQKVGEFNKEAMIWMLNEAPKCKRFSDSDSLHCSFDWSDTPQGEDFWYNISETLEQVKEV